MPTIGAQLVGTEDGGAILLEDEGALLLETGDALNTQASEDKFGKYSICDRTGFRLYPWESEKEWTGFETRPRSIDQRNLQEFRVGTEKNLDPGAKRPELEDQFLTSSIAAEDL